MENSFEKFDDLIKHVKEYVNNSIALFKIELAEKISGVISNIIALFFVIIIFLMVIIFFSISLALILGKITGENFWGFLIVSGLYFVVGILVWKGKDRIIRIPIMNSILRQLFNEED